MERGGLDILALNFPFHGDSLACHSPLLSTSSPAPFPLSLFKFRGESGGSTVVVGDLGPARILEGLLAALA